MRDAHSARELIAIVQFRQSAAVAFLVGNAFRLQFLIAIV
jgi:hypothetical protein